MKHFYELLITFCLVSCGMTIQAQNSITSGGGNATTSAGSVNYTIGQIFYVTVIGSNSTITHGVHQPFEISVNTGLPEASGIILQFSVYPNPANGFVILKVEDYQTDNLIYKLYDINGMLFQNEKIQDVETQIQLENVLPGTYFLKIIDRNKEIKTFKIIKK